MAKCQDCVHLGVLVPKRGGWFHSRTGNDDKRITQPNIPYCGRLNVAVNADSYITCNYHEEYKEPEVKEDKV